MKRPTDSFMVGRFFTFFVSGIVVSVIPFHYVPAILNRFHNHKTKPFIGYFHSVLHFNTVYLQKHFKRIEKKHVSFALTACRICDAL